MIRNRLLLPSLFLLVMAALSLAGCHHHRPPAISTAPPPGGSGFGSESGGREQPVDSGPDIKSIANEPLTAGDLSDAATGEGGPLADIQFAYDQATLSDPAKGTLEKHALWLQSHRDAKVAVEGHCDERGTAEYNLALGDQRAQATRDYLVSLGIAADRLRATSFGKERPLDPGHDESAWAKNRRAHFAVSR